MIKIRGVYMKTLEDILQDFGLTGSIDDNSIETYKIYEKLIEFIYDIGDLTDIDMERVIVELDEIMSSNGGVY